MCYRAYYGAFSFALARTTLVIRLIVKFFLTTILIISIEFDGSYFKKIGDVKFLKLVDLLNTFHFF